MSWNGCIWEPKQVKAILLAAAAMILGGCGSVVQPQPAAQFHRDVPLTFVSHDFNQTIYRWAANMSGVPPVSRETGRVAIRLETRNFGNGYHVTFRRAAGAWVVRKPPELHAASAASSGAAAAAGATAPVGWAEITLDPDHRYLVAADPEGEDPLIVDISPNPDDFVSSGQPRELLDVKVVATK